MIPYGRQEIKQEDIDAVVDVLQSDFLTQGPMVPRFEETVAKYCGAKHAVAVNSATSALHIACLALDLAPGDWLWTSPNTFVASANCALYCGAQVDFVDIDPRTYNLCPQKLEQKLIQAEKNGTLPKVVIPVHFAGQPCDMPAIHALSEKYGFKIIEDASHAIGASYADRLFSPGVIASSSEAATRQSIRQIKVGSSTHSDITVFSFHPVKIITTGEGGMALTNNSELAKYMARLRTHGITKDPAQMQNTPTGPWYYEQLELGYNYRMTDLQAALGLSQLNRLDEFVKRRNEIAKHYDKLLRDLPVKRPHLILGAYSSWHLYPIRLQLDLVKTSHRQVFEALREEGIGVNLHYMPVHLQPYYRSLGFSEGQFSEAEQHVREAISLPIHYGLSSDEQNQVIEKISTCLGA